MNRFDMIKMSIKSLWRRKLRTILTILGVIIGATSIVVMMSIGLGMKRKLDKQFDNWGNRKVIEAYQRYTGKENEDGISDKKIAKINNITGVDVVIPEISMRIKMVTGREGQDVRLVGMSKEAMIALDYIPTTGELFNNKDDKSFVVGGEVKNRFRKIGKDSMEFVSMYDRNKEEKDEVDSKDIFNINIRANYENQYGERNVDLPNGVNMPKPIKMRIVGEVESDRYDVKRAVFAPVALVEKLKEEEKKYEAKKYEHEYVKSKEKYYNSVKIKVNNIEDIDFVSEEIKKLGLDCWSMKESIDETNKVTKTIQLVLGLIGGVSLFIAAIGITNTMIMAIYERKKEIGIMKVVGADIKDIKNMFLSEAGMIGLVGGAIGIGLSYLVSFIINTLASNAEFMQGSPGGEELGISYIPISLTACALIFSILIGVISGYIPALKAMKITVLEAISDS